MTVTAAEIKNAFNLFDEDLKGSVTTDCMKLVLASIGFGELSEQETTALIKAMDTDGSGRIDYHEYERTVLRKRPEAGSPEEILRAFKLFDERGVGKITKDDLKATAQRCGYALSDDQVDAIMKQTADDEKVGIMYDNWRCSMNNLQGANRKSTKL